MKRQNKLFVYGTLRRDCKFRAINLEEYSLFLGYGKVKGRLYEVDNYPGVVLGGEKEVIGELYEVFDFELFDILDRYEECSREYPPPTEYKRVVCKVKFNSKMVNAWVYEYNLDTSTLQLIESGDYVEFKNGKV